jgi:hypothetical protein
VTSQDPEFNQFLATCSEIGSWFPEGIVYIDGIAIYIHAINHADVAPYAQATHDGDFYISLADMSDLRDLEEVTPNRRLSKHQIIKNGFEFDIYTERQSNLLVPFDVVQANAVQYGDLRVCGLTELFVLKLEAFRDRRQSAKGAKDVQDLYRLALLSKHLPFEADQAAAYLDDGHFEAIAAAQKHPAVVAMAGGNAVLAKHIRSSFKGLADEVIAAAGGSVPPPHRGSICSTDS